jgi:hypothetical protein
VGKQQIMTKKKIREKNARANAAGGPFSHSKKMISKRVNVRDEFSQAEMSSSCEKKERKREGEISFFFFLVFLVNFKS